MASTDTTLFLWLTASLQSPHWAVALARLLAGAVVPLIAVALVLAWIRARRGWRPALLDALAAGGLGLGLVQIVGWFHYRPRPFEAGLGANLLHHVPENSFPSDHATLMFALAVSLLAAAPTRKAGAVLLGLALAVSWARIYLGVHYPTDILGGLGLALVCVGFLRALPFRLGLWVVVERIYQRLIVTLHLPEALFPRGS